MSPYERWLRETNSDRLARLEDRVKRLEDNLAFLEQRTEARAQVFEAQMRRLVGKVIDAIVDLRRKFSS